VNGERRITAKARRRSPTDRLAVIYPMALASRAACGYHFEAVNYGHWCVTSFRDPIKRLISLYNLFKFDVKLSEEELGNGTLLRRGIRDENGQNGASNN
jgi:hypothetical protein